MGLFSAIAGPLIGGIAGGLLSDSPDAPDPAKTGINALPPWWRTQLVRGAEGARRDFARGPEEMFAGQTYAGLTPFQKQGLFNQASYARNLGGQLGQINQSFGNALNAGDLYSDPSVRRGLSSIESRANRNFQREILPSLRRGATSVGQEFGTRGQLAEGVAASDLQSRISDAQGQFLGNQLDSARRLQSQALGQAPNITQLGLLPGSTLFNVGSQFQNQRQQQIDEEIQRHFFPRQALRQNLGNYINNITALAGTGGTPSVTPGATPPGISPLSGILGGALIGNQIGGSLAPAFSSPQPSYYGGTASLFG